MSSSPVSSLRHLLLAMVLALAAALAFSLQSVTAATHTATLRLSITGTSDETVYKINESGAQKIALSGYSTLHLLFDGSKEMRQVKPENVFLGLKCAKLETGILDPPQRRVAAEACGARCKSSGGVLIKLSSINFEPSNCVMTVSVRDSASSTVHKMGSINIQWGGKAGARILPSGVLPEIYHTFAPEPAIKSTLFALPFSVLLVAGFLVIFVGGASKINQNESRSSGDKCSASSSSCSATALLLMCVAYGILTVLYWTVLNLPQMIFLSLISSLVVIPVVRRSVYQIFESSC